MTTAQVLARLEAAWRDFEESYAGLSDEELLVPGVTGAWSVRDIIAHVTWWEEEALKHLPLVREGGRPPRYSVRYGGIDAFNALMTEQRRGLTLAEVLRQHDDVHARLVAYVREAPPELYARETRFRRRLRLDAIAHYPIHARAIRAWRAARLPNAMAG
ncbi:MAG TPA: DinB family protein [Gemmatimonadaceae bacterium]|nr:DinB family protein [Gemmatimonadaceae bacterium]